MVAFSFAEKPNGKSLPKGFATNDIFRSKAFIENKDLIQPYKGEEVKFMMSYKGMQAFFTTDGLVYKMSEVVEKKEAEKEREKEKEPEEARDLKNYFVHMKWLGANANCEIVAEENQHVDHVFMKRNGEEFSTVRTNAYSRIVYKNIYEGIDAVYTLEEKGGIKYNLVLHPGADANQIRMAYDGDVKNVRLDKEGNVVIATKVGKITDHAPHTFSESNVELKSSFELKGKTVQFHLPENYDRNQTITIDPWVTNNNVLSFYEGGFTVDYDYLGNLFVYGGGWSGEPYKVAAYPLAGGASTYVFNGTVPGISWSSEGVEDDPGNIVVERTTGKVYIGEGVQDFGARIVRLDVSGNYDNFVSITNNQFIECWGLVFNCGTGKIYVAGGSYNDETDFGILDPGTANVVTSNITGNTSALRQDIACMAQNSVGEMYTLFSEP